MILERFISFSSKKYLQTSASDWDASRQLPLLWAGGDDAAAAQERRHQPRPVHRLAGHHDQGDTQGLDISETLTEIKLQDMPPTLFIRGNQQSVLTFYS